MIKPKKDVPDGRYQRVMSSSLKAIADTAREKLKVRTRVLSHLR